MIPYGRQSIGDDDVLAVSAALRDPYLTQGPRIAEFERRLAEASGARFAVAVNSGTAALHAAYFAAGFGPGQTLLTTPITFVATANSALYLGGSVKFCDVDRGSISLDGAAVEACQDSINLVTPVYFGGHVANPERLHAVARARGWRIVEDAAHALGARYRSEDGKEYRVGSCAHSDLCCFSFHPVKHVTTGEGGAVTTNDEVMRDRLLLFRSHGITRDRAQLTDDDGPWYYEQHALGFNYRLTDFQCALGLSQLAKLDGFVARRRAIAAMYDRLFEGHARIRVISEPANSVGSYHLYVIRVPADIRRSVYDALREADIGVNVHYIPVYRQPFYRANGFAGFALAEAESYYSEAITIPMYPDLTDDQVASVARVVLGLVDRLT